MKKYILKLSDIDIMGSADLHENYYLRSILTKNGFDLSKKIKRFTNVASGMIEYTQED